MHDIDQPLTITGTLTPASLIHHLVNLPFRLIGKMVANRKRNIQNLNGSILCVAIKCSRPFVNNVFAPFAFNVKLLSQLFSVEVEPYRF